MYVRIRNMESWVYSDLYYHMKILKSLAILQLFVLWHSTKEYAQLNNVYSTIYLYFYILFVSYLIF